jgi:hypothetical protein
VLTMRGLFALPVRSQVQILHPRPRHCLKATACIGPWRANRANGEATSCLARALVLLHLAGGALGAPPPLLAARAAP